MASIMVAEYLTEEEATALKGQLQPICRHVIVKRHGLPRIFGLDINYRVFVGHDDAPKVADLVARFQHTLTEKRNKAKSLLESQCPTCTSTSIRRKEKVSLIERIRYAGVTVWECKGCGGRWYT